MPSTNQYLIISDFGFEEKLPVTQCRGLLWLHQSSYYLKKNKKKKTQQNTKMPNTPKYILLEHILGGGWECVKTAAAASINNCHLDVTRQDRKEKSGNGVILTLFFSTAYLSSPCCGVFHCSPSMKMSLNLDYTMYFNNKPHHS